ncbi:MAG: ABC transporter permease subunit [Acidihalobacter sp.]|uniref:ABC transporter permease subunit n=1 Tax=Acidihalobacter sp. TaxID=1872108 RepID=UPI00307E7B2C
MGTTMQTASDNTTRTRQARRRQQYRPFAPQGRETFFISTATVAAMLLLWWISTSLGWIKPLFLPSPAAVFAAFKHSLMGGVPGQPTLIENTTVSLARVFGAFLLAILTAVPVGLAMGTSRIANGIFDPLIEFYRPLPPLAYLPLVIIWLGIGETAKITLIYLACFAPLVIATKAGVRSVPVEQINAAFSLGASRWQVLRHVILRGSMPEIITGMRIAIGFGWTTLVAAEMVAANTGLGQMVLKASNFLRTDVVIMGIVVIGVMAFAFDLMMRKLETLLVPWKGKM